MAIVANGCAGGTANATMEVPVGVTLAPFGEDMIASSVDLPLAGAGSTGEVVDGERLALAPVGACAVASGSSHTMATAQSLGTCAQGALVDQDAGQYFVFNPEPNLDYAMRLVGDGDATFDLGVPGVGPGGEHTCTVFSPGLVATRFSAAAGVGDLCVVVHSDSGSAQAFRLGLAH
jgi:hypothetical protein